MTIYSLLKFNILFKRINHRKHKVVFINTYDQGGGAAKICYQLFSSLENTIMYVRTKRTLHTNVKEFEPDLWNRFGAYARNVEKKFNLIDFGKLGVIKLLADSKFSESKILHIHNSHGYYLSLLGLQIVSKGKKIIWTLHDDYILTGHCSFTMNCDKWMTACDNCPSLEVYPSLSKDTSLLNQLEKKNTIMELQPYIVTPSKWLSNRVKIKYPFLSNVKVIYNGIDIENFIPIADKDSLRTKFNIPSKKIILFIAELSVKNPFKGGDILMKIIEEFKENDEYVFLTVGGDTGENTNLISLPYISDEKALNEVYNLADIMLYPTRADNLPLVVLESMSCGIPVISNDIAGIPEIINNGVDGYLVSDYNINSYITTLETFFNLDINSKNNISGNARAKIVENFNLKTMMSEYHSLYETV